MRWPGVIEPGSVHNEMFAHEDMLPTFMAAVGDTTIAERLKEGDVEAIGREYKAHLDGYNLMPYLSGETDTPPRESFIYWTDDGDVAALRYNNWKIVFMEQRAHGFQVWQEPFVTLRFPKLFNLRMDPFEEADHNGEGYFKWMADRMYALAPAQAYVAGWLSSFREFPPRQEPGSFSLSNVMDKMTSGRGSN